MRDVPVTLETMGDADLQEKELEIQNWLRSRVADNPERPMVESWLAMVQLVMERRNLTPLDLNKIMSEE